MDTAAELELPELDALQAHYKALVDAWIAAIRTEEALATQPHDVADVDAWEAASFAQDELRDKVKAAKEAYEAALRKKFYNF